MKFKLDENLPTIAADVFIEANYDACTVYQQELSGIPDDSLITLMKQEQRILVTLDMDFSDIRVYPPSSHSGIIILRPPSQDVPSIVSMLMRLMPLLAVESIYNQLWIVEAHRVRIRE